MSVELRPAATRPVTRQHGRTTAHSFSFGAHYDPDDVGFGALVAHNDDRLDPGCGYALHRHSGLQIVTWVLAGRLQHRHVVDGVEAVSEIGPGEVQVLATGGGVEHSEYAADTPVHLVQTWLADPSPGPVDYRRAKPAIPPNALATVVGNGALDWHLPVRLGVARLTRRGVVTVPAAGWSHLFVVAGDVLFGGVGAGPGDALRVIDDGGDMSTQDGATVLVWSGT